MSGEAEKWAWSQTWCEGHQKFVLVTMARLAEGWVYTGGVEKLSRVTRLSVDSVKRAVRRLVFDGSPVTRTKRGVLHLKPEISANLPLKGAEMHLSPELGANPHLSRGDSGHPASSPGGVSPNTLFPLPSPLPSKPPTSLKGTTESKVPRWVKDLNRLGWARADPLDSRETARIVHDYGMVDIGSEVEQFVTYWSRKKHPGSWQTYRRLRKWLDKPKTALAERTERIAGTNGRDQRIPDDQSEYVQSIKRLNG